MLRRQLSCLFAIFAISLARPAVSDELPIVVGVTAPLRVASPNAAPLFKSPSSSPSPRPSVRPEDVPSRWMEIQVYNNQPLTPRLSGLGLEYRIVQIYSRDRGKREATIGFDVGQG